jgi:hypothetical protein
MEQNLTKKVWLVANEMGYGHQRTAFNLRELAFENQIIQADNYQNIPLKDKLIWTINRNSYYLFSKSIDVPIIGKKLFNFFDYFQRIEDFYSNKNVVKPTLQTKSNYFLIKLGFGKHFIQTLKDKNKNLPFVSTFFTPAFMAEYWHYPGEIFCIVCDTDVSRAWVPLEISKSKIKYFAPTKRVAKRLEKYGVKKENIYLTGYPLPIENLGDRNLSLLKERLRQRLLNLDPKNSFQKKYFFFIKKYLGSLPENPDHKLSLMLAIGGAGAQVKASQTLLEGLRNKISKNLINLTLVAGKNLTLKNYFLANIKFLKLEDNFQKNLKIIYNPNINNFFKEFNLELLKTDILLTKPSELSFYAGLGLPIVILPPIGSHEILNKNWLIRKGAGIGSEDLKYIENWLEDFLNEGLFFKAAISGFLEIKKLGTFKIIDILQKI